MDEVINMILIPTYALSSHVGFALFFYIWLLTRADRKALYGAADNPVSAVGNKEKAVGWRNEVVAGILALAFFFYAIATDLVLIRIALELGDDSWYRFATVVLLVLGNILEMSIAFALIYSRKEIRGKDSALNPARWGRKLLSMWTKK